MNLESFVLPALELEQSQMREVLQCLLHTILFHRALGIQTPRVTVC